MNGALPNQKRRSSNLLSVYTLNLDNDNGEKEKFILFIKKNNIYLKK